MPVRLSRVPQRSAAVLLPSVGCGAAHCPAALGDHVATILPLALRAPGALASEVVILTDLKVLTFDALRSAHPDSVGAALRFDLLVLGFLLVGRLPGQRRTLPGAVLVLVAFPATLALIGSTPRSPGARAVPVPIAFTPRAIRGPITTSRLVQLEILELKVQPWLGELHALRERYAHRQVLAVHVAPRLARRLIQTA